ncbi:MAG: cytochrome C, partial [Burkholderiaceae bacterium]|nr:cytochrome C [Burkholderiaceae bacterium]
MKILHPGFLSAWALALAAAGLPLAHAAETTAAQQLSQWSAQAGAPGQADKGKAFFNAKHGGEWSCASC